MTRTIHVRGSTHTCVARKPRRPLRQRGFALAMVLLLLVVATLLALTAVHQSAGQEQLAANHRAWSMAYAGAEAATRAAERWLYEYPTTAGGAALAANASLGGNVYGRGDATTHPALQNFLQPRVWTAVGAQQVPGGVFATAPDATARLAAEPVYLIEDLGAFRPPGAGTIAEGGASGSAGYEGTAGMSPAGNADLRVFRTVGKSLGSGADADSAFVVTLWSTFAGRPQGG